MTCLFLLDNENMKYLKTKYPCQSKRVKWLEDEHVRTFSHWLRKKGMKLFILPLKFNAYKI